MPSRSRAACRSTWAACLFPSASMPHARAVRQHASDRRRHRSRARRSTVGSSSAVRCIGRRRRDCQLSRRRMHSRRSFARRCRQHPASMTNPPVSSDSSAGISAFVAQIRQTHVPGRESWIDKSGAQRSAAARSAARRRIADVARRSMCRRSARIFPILRQKVNGKPLAWLDNAATTQKPQSVIDAHLALLRERLLEHPPRRPHAGRPRDRRLRKGPRRKCSRSSAHHRSRKSSSSAARPKASTSSPTRTAASSCSRATKSCCRCSSITRKSSLGRWSPRKKAPCCA